MKRFIVETCTVHGPTKRRRWHRVHTDQTKAACETWVDQAVATLPPQSVAGTRSFGLTQERARAMYRIRGQQVAA